MPNGFVAPENQPSPAPFVAPENQGFVAPENQPPRLKLRAVGDQRVYPPGTVQEQPESPFKPADYAAVNPVTENPDHMSLSDRALESMIYPGVAEQRLVANPLNEVGDIADQTARPVVGAVGTVLSTIGRPFKTYLRAMTNTPEILKQVEPYTPSIPPDTASPAISKAIAVNVGLARLAWHNIWNPQDAPTFPDIKKDLGIPNAATQPSVWDPQGNLNIGQAGLHTLDEGVNMLGDMATDPGQLALLGIHPGVSPEFEAAQVAARDAVQAGRAGRFLTKEAAANAVPKFSDAIAAGQAGINFKVPFGPDIGFAQAVPKFLAPAARWADLPLEFLSKSITGPNPNSSAQLLQTKFEGQNTAMGNQFLREKIAKVRPILDNAGVPTSEAETLGALKERLDVDAKTFRSAASPNPIPETSMDPGQNPARDFEALTSRQPGVAAETKAAFDEGPAHFDEGDTALAHYGTLPARQQAALFEAAKQLKAGDNAEIDMFRSKGMDPNILNAKELKRFPDLLEEHNALSTVLEDPHNGLDSGQVKATEARLADIEEQLPIAAKQFNGVPSYRPGIIQKDTADLTREGTNPNLGLPKAGQSPEDAVRGLKVADLDKKYADMGDVKATVYQGQRYRGVGTPSTAGVSTGIAPPTTWQNFMTKIGVQQYKDAAAASFFESDPIKGWERKVRERDVRAMTNFDMEKAYTTLYDQINHRATVQPIRAAVFNGIAGRDATWLDLENIWKESGRDDTLAQNMDPAVFRKIMTGEMPVKQAITPDWTPYGRKVWMPRNLELAHMAANPPADAGPWRPPEPEVPPAEAAKFFQDQFAPKPSATPLQDMVDSLKPKAPAFNPEDRFEPQREAKQPAKSFYSPLDNALNAQFKNAKTFQNAQGLLNQLKRVVNPEELADTGLDAFLSSHKGPLNRAELDVFLKENRPVISVGTTGQSAVFPEVTRYDAMKLPASKVPKAQSLDPRVIGPSFDTGNYRETLIKQEGLDYEHPHWDGEKSVIAHVRSQDRMLPGGRALEIQEIQSDLHQQGKSKGYESQPDIDRLDALQSKMKESVRNGTEFSQEDKSEYHRLANSPTTNGIPNAPFKDSWHKLAFKQTLDDAVRGDPREPYAPPYKYVTWPGEEAQVSKIEGWGTSKAEQAARVAELDSVSDPKTWHSVGSTRMEHTGTGYTIAKDGDEFVIKHSRFGLQDGARFDTFEGAVKRVAEEGEQNLQHQRDTLSGMDSQTAISNWYTKDLPSFVKKYVQPMGGKVSLIDTPNGKMWAVELTDALRNRIKNEGQPLYGAAQPAPSKTPWMEPWQEPSFTEVPKKPWEEPTATPQEPPLDAPPPSIPVAEPGETGPPSPGPENYMHAGALDELRSYQKMGNNIDGIRNAISRIAPGYSALVGMQKKLATLWGPGAPGYVAMKFLHDIVRGEIGDAWDLQSPGELIRGQQGHWRYADSGGMDVSQITEYDFGKAGRLSGADAAAIGERTRAMGNAGEIPQELQKGGVDPSQNKLTLAGAGRKMENFVRGQDSAMRLAAVAKYMRDGATEGEAAFQMQKAFFDFSRQGPVTRILSQSGAVPFAAWQSKVVPFMLKWAVENPGEFMLVQKGLQAVNANVIPASQLPDFIRRGTNIAVSVSKDKDGHIEIGMITDNGIIPGDELAHIAADPRGALLEKLGAPLRMLKVAWDHGHEDATDPAKSTAGDWSWKYAKAAFGRPASIFNTLSDSSKSTAEQVASVFSPVPLENFDLTKQGQVSVQTTKTDLKKSLYAVGQAQITVKAAQDAFDAQQKNVMQMGPNGLNFAPNDRAMIKAQNALQQAKQRVQREKDQFTRTIAEYRQARAWAQPMSAVK